MLLALPDPAEASAGELVVVAASLCEAPGAQSYPHGDTRLRQGYGVPSNAVATA
jgi:hypothetical protein